MSKTGVSIATGKLHPGQSGSTEVVASCVYQQLSTMLQKVKGDVQQRHLQESERRERVC